MGKIMFSHSLLYFDIDKYYKRMYNLYEKTFSGG